MQTTESRFVYCLGSYIFVVRFEMDTAGMAVVLMQQRWPVPEYYGRVG